MLGLNPTPESLRTCHTYDGRKCGASYLISVTWPTYPFFGLVAPMGTSMPRSETVCPRSGQYTLSGQLKWRVANETTSGENFAEKWNLHPERAAAFYEWHQRVLADVGQLAELEGSDRITKSLGQSFGTQAANDVAAIMAEEVNAARQGKTVSVARGLGVLTGATSAIRSAPVRANTFFGRG